MARESRILREVLETARELRDARLIDAKSMRRFRALCRRRAVRKSYGIGRKRVR